MTAQSSPVKLIYTSMVADLFHVGHLNLLKRAAQLGDKLIVGIIDDQAVYDYKGRFPVFSMQDRMAIVSAVQCVDAVIAQHSRDGSENIRNLEGLYAVVRGNDAILQGEKSLIEEMGGRYVLLPRTEGISTSEILLKILNSQEHK